MARTEEEIRKIARYFIILAEIEVEIEDEDEE